MSVGLPSKDHYQTAIQEVLHLYSQSAPALDKCLDDMNVCKGTWDRTRADLQNIDAKEKTNISNTALAKYDTFIKTSKFAAELFNRLQETCIECTRPEIDPATYTTMSGLGEKAESFHQKVEALATVRELLGSLATRFDNLYKSRIDTRLLQIVTPLEQLIGTINPSLAGWCLGGFRTPALDSAYKNWTENASDAQKNWTPEIDKTILNSASFGSIEPSSAKLNRALKTLNLTYIDPMSKIGYGIVPEEKSIESQGKEEENQNTPSSAQKAIETQGKEEDVNASFIQKTNSFSSEDISDDEFFNEIEDPTLPSSSSQELEEKISSSSQEKGKSPVSERKHTPSSPQVGSPAQLQRNLGLARRNHQNSGSALGSGQ